MPWHTYRITKYDPRFRASDGAYTRNAWTSVDDIGESFDGADVLTFEEYVRTENQYTYALAAFLEEAGVDVLEVRGLEVAPRWAEEAAGFQEGARIPRLGALDHCRLLLRGELSCRLETPEFYCHVGYDYYMYIGATRPCPESVERACEAGLFAEPDFPSPLLERQPDRPGEQGR
jgi:hypothetical protein